VGFWNERKQNSPNVFFPSEYDSGWSKNHGRLERWRLQRAAVTPEESGLCGCWQFIAVWRERQKLRHGKIVETAEEYSFYAASLAHDEHNAEKLAQYIRGHWSACENGSHYRRDVTLGEDASRVSGRSGAQTMATLRNLVLGLFELQKDKGKAAAQHVPGWRRRMSATRAIQLITKGA
jgi:predicted transposase YbfD/YdcC